MDGRTGARSIVLAVRGVSQLVFGKESVSAGRLPVAEMALI